MRALPCRPNHSTAPSAAQDPAEPSPVERLAGTPELPPRRRAPRRARAISPQAQTRLKFVQIGLWEARRRWHAGRTADLGRLLALLDEDVEHLRRALLTNVAPEALPPDC